MGQSAGLRWLTLGFVLLAIPAEAKCELSDLGWMIGRWGFRNGAYFGQESWSFSESGQLIEFVTGSGAPSSDGVVKLSVISSEQGTLILRMRFFDGSLKHALEDRDAPVLLSLSACGPGFVRFDGRDGEYTRYKRSGVDMINTGIASNIGKPGRYRVLLTRTK